MATHINVNGSWIKNKAIYVNVNGSWVKSKTKYINVNGSWYASDKTEPELRNLQNDFNSGIISYSYDGGTNTAGIALGAVNSNCFEAYSTATDKLPHVALMYDGATYIRYNMSSPRLYNDSSGDKAIGLIFYFWNTSGQIEHFTVSIYENRSYYTEYKANHNKSIVAKNVGGFTTTDYMTGKNRISYIDNTNKDKSYSFVYDGDTRIASISNGIITHSFSMPSNFLQFRCAIPCICAWWSGNYNPEVVVTDVYVRY